MVSGVRRWKMGPGPEWCQFSFSHHITNFDPTDSPFFMLVGTVVKREADLSMNLALTGAREKVIDYSVAYIGVLKQPSHLILC